jgi:FkbM family methyltransferase
LRLIRLQNVQQGPTWDIFFSVLKAHGFAPKHIIDVGANHGRWTRCALKYFPSAYYTLVEPQDYLKTDVQDLLGLNRIRWISAGVSDRPGTLPFAITQFDYGSSFNVTLEAIKVRALRQIEVPVTTLNEIVRTSDAPLPDMVKIDAEGFDLRVIAGASELIGKTDIFLLEAAICADYSPESGESILENTLTRVIDTMERSGYRIIDITDLNRSPKNGVLWLCEVAFLRKGSRLLDGVTWD